MRRKSKCDKMYRKALMYGFMWKPKSVACDKYFERVTWGNPGKSDKHSRSDKQYLIWLFKNGYFTVKPHKK